MQNYRNKVSWQASAVVGHDPVVAADSDRDLLFTRRLIADLRAGATWVANLVDVSGPTPAFEAEVSATLRSSIRQIDKTFATNMMLVAENSVNAQYVFTHSGSGAIANVKPKLQAALRKSSSASHDVVLAQTAATLAAAGARKAQQLMQGMMGNIARLNAGGMAYQGRMTPLNQMVRHQQTKTMRQASPVCQTGQESISYCLGGNA